MLYYEKENESRSGSPPPTKAKGYRRTPQTGAGLLYHDAPDHTRKGGSTMNGEKQFYLNLITQLFSDSLDLFIDHPEGIEEEYQAIRRAIPQGEKMEKTAPLAQMIIGFILGMDQGMKICEQMERAASKQATPAKQ